ncbi:glycosyl hydrolase, family 92 protein [Marssonina coronariae]|uniref:Glycosyl hydrolase, family 92 protein n=1 Tax=Diplocarpon coronariae TaxID=2795749 RepID=A0A218YT70_9HELO|nr:glycosyl hydrolase, family 92 protein [Marssonina coronariae]
MEPSPSHTANVFKGPAAAGSVRQTPRFANSSSSIDYISGFSTFDAPFVSSKVGISWISVKKACQNVNDQIPAGTKFSAVVQNTKTAWNTDILSKITTTTTDASNLNLLHPSLYFINI